MFNSRAVPLAQTRRDVVVVCQLSGEKRIRMLEGRSIGVCVGGRWDGGVALLSLQDCSVEAAFLTFWRD